MDNNTKSRLSVVINGVKRALNLKEVKKEVEVVVIESGKNHTRCVVVVRDSNDSSAKSFIANVKGLVSIIEDSEKEYPFSGTEILRRVL